MAKGKKATEKTTQGWRVARLRDMSGGLNLAVAPDLLNDNEASQAEFIDYGQKGVLRPAPGRAKRFAEVFSQSHVSGMGTLYKKDLTTRLLMAAGIKLYADLPHFLEAFDTQQEWETGTRFNIDTTSEPGKIKPTDPPADKQKDWDTQAHFDAGTFFQTVSKSEGHVELEVESEGRDWDVSTMSYDGKSFSVASQETSPYGLFFKSDGTKMYIVGSTNDTVYQYTLSVAWDVSTASYDGKSFSVASQEISPGGLFFKSDGTKMYIMGYATDTVYQYTLSPPVYYSSGTWTSEEFDADEEFLAWVQAAITKTTPANTTITVEYRAKDPGGTFSGWTTDITTLTGRILQVKATLETTDTSVTPKLERVLVDYSVQYEYIWISPSIDVSGLDLSDGKVSHLSDVPAQATIAISTRTSADQENWSAWQTIDVDGSILSPNNNYLQVKVEFTYEADKPWTDWLKAVIGAEPSAQEIYSGLTDGASVWFEQFMDIATIWNGVDTPLKFDGTTVSALGGSPPVAKMAITHQNCLWAIGSAANPSRIWFSEALDPESWPVLNFIDVQPDDGDHLTGGIRVGESLVLTKQHSTWVLLGDGVENYAIRRVHAAIGAMSGRSLCLLPTGHLTFVADDGVWMTDLAEFANITERLRPLWDGLNHRRLSAAASVYHEHRLYVAVPHGAATTPNRVIVLDMLRKAFDVRPGWNVSCWTYFQEAGLRNLYFGDSTQGQAWGINGATEDGSAVPALWESKAFDFQAPEQLKRIGRIWLTILPDGVAAELEMRFRTDVGSELSEAITVSVPASRESALRVVYPSQVGIAVAKNLSVHLTWKTAAARTQVHSIAFEYLALGLKEV